MKTLALGLGISSVIGVAFFASACGNTVQVGKGGAGGMTGATTVGNTVATATNGAGGMTSATGTGSVGTSTGNVGTSTGSGVNCMMAPGDTACSSCVKSQCCPQITACSGDAQCNCYASCALANPNALQMCYTQCGMMLPDMTTQAVLSCGYQKCQQQCQGGMTTATTGTGTTTGASMTTTSTGGMTCPILSGDTMCVQCAKMHCCTQYDACAADMTCTCWAGCLQSGKTFQQCYGMCGAPDMATGQLGQCVNMNNCGCGTAMGG